MYFWVFWVCGPNITFAKLINNGNDMYIMRKRRSSQYQENCLLHFNSILINYKLVLEELDVLGEEYERPARCRKWYRQFWDFFGGLITFVRGRPDDQILNNYGWTSHGLLLTYIRLDHDFCFSSFSLLLNCRITQAVMIAELLEGKLLKLLHSKCAQCTRTTFTFNILTSVLCW